MPTKSQTVVMLHCNGCCSETKHLLIASRTRSRSRELDRDYQVHLIVTSEMLECRGCESVTLRIKSDFSEDLESSVSYCPARTDRRMPVWHSKLKWSIRSLLEEVYEAFHADSNRLAMMGARALIDMAIVELVGDQGTFSDKLKQLNSQGFVSSKSVKVLQAALDAGHAATHRGHAFNREEISHVMDIVENLLQSTLLESAAQKLIVKTPKRVTQ